MSAPGPSPEGPAGGDGPPTDPAGDDVDIDRMLADIDGDLDRLAAADLERFERDADADLRDPAALLRSLDRPGPLWRWRFLALGVVAFTVLLVGDALWRSFVHGEWIRLPGVPVLVVVAGVAGSRAWERADPHSPDAGRPDAGRPDAHRPDGGRPDAAGRAAPGPGT